MQSAPYEYIVAIRQAAIRRLALLTVLSFMLVNYSDGTFVQPIIVWNVMAVFTGPIPQNILAGLALLGWLYVWSVVIAPRKFIWLLVCLAVAFLWLDVLYQGFLMLSADEFALVIDTVHLRFYVPALVFLIGSVLLIVKARRKLIRKRTATAEQPETDE